MKHNMNLIQYRNTDKPEFYLLRDVPVNIFNGSKEGRDMFERSLKYCESKAIRIDNPEVLPINIEPQGCSFQDRTGYIKHGETFPLPEGIKFEGCEVLHCDKDHSHTKDCYAASIRLKKEDKEPAIKTAKEIVIEALSEDSFQNTGRRIEADSFDDEDWYAFQMTIKCMEEYASPLKRRIEELEKALYSARILLEDEGGYLDTVKTIDELFIEELRKDNDHNIQRALEIARERDELRKDNERLRERLGELMHESYMQSIEIKALTQSNKELVEALKDSFEYAKCGWNHNYPHVPYEDSQKLSKAVKILKSEGEIK